LKILYLAHRIPFPPNKGDKIRSFHEIRHFSKRHEIHLLSFYDDPKESAYAEDLKQYCKSVTLVPLYRRRQQARAMSAMLKGRPWTLGYFSNPGMHAVVCEKLRSARPDAIFVYSSSMAPYVASCKEIPKFIDFVDSDASKWLQYAQLKPFPACWLYAYEGKKLARFEEEMVETFDASIFVSAREAAHLRSSRHWDKIHFVQNGIDIDRFARTRTAEPSNTILFTGVMDYFPNVDAVCFFAHEVLPLVRKQCPDARFLIVGIRPAAAVQQLATLPGVTVTGMVPDVLPYLEKAQVAVVPVRISRGIQNKILEALAAGLPVVTTSAVAEGLTSTGDFPLAVADDPESFAAGVVSFLQKAPTAEQIASGLRRLKRDYDWGTNLSAFDVMFGGKYSFSSTSAAQ
jgi:sugar transferase (PEP-CTERM/EpsH1 system associated)